MDARTGSGSCPFAATGIKYVETSICYNSINLLVSGLVWTVLTESHNLSNWSKLDATVKLSRCIGSVHYIVYIVPSPDLRTGNKTQRSLLGLCRVCSCFCTFRFTFFLGCKPYRLYSPWGTWSMVFVCHFSHWISSARLMLVNGGRKGKLGLETWSSWQLIKKSHYYCWHYSCFLHCLISCESLFR